MRLLLPKNLPRYDCLIEAAKTFPDLDPSACEAFLCLLRAGNDVVHDCEGYFTGHDLSQGRFTVLMLLLDKNKNAPLSRTPAELADLANVTRATMTGLIDTLERDALVTREPDADDRRMTSVTLTAKGHALLRRILPGYFQHMTRLMAPLSESERKALARLLVKLIPEAPATHPSSHHHSPHHETATAAS
jgi:DNA-binding MarR family transcriptional regulator